MIRKKKMIWKRFTYLVCLVFMNAVVLISSYDAYAAGSADLNEVYAAVSAIRDFSGFYADDNPMCLLYQSEFFKDDEKLHIPPETVVHQGELYFRKNYELHSDLSPRLQHVIKEYTYMDVEAYDVIPTMKEFDVTDEETGREFRAELPLNDFTYRDRHWEDDFTFPITVEHADAESWTLNEYVFPALEQDEENPFYGCEEAFLEYLGLPEEDYHITEIKWTSKPWERDGIQYRSALAKGEKRVARVDAVYEGDIIVSEEQEKVITAVYEKKKDNQDVLEGDDDHTGIGQNSSQEVFGWWKNWIHDLWKLIQKYRTESFYISVSAVAAVIVLLSILWKKRIHRAAGKKKS